MRRILVVGDSFMKPDADYPGEHFSEMLGSVETIVMSHDGSSMGMVLDQIIQGLNYEPDGIIIGFTAQDRVEWPRQDGLPGQWIPSGAVGAMTAQQKELDLQWRTSCDPHMNNIKAHAMASGIMTMLTHLKIPFAWTPNLLYYSEKIPYHQMIDAMLAPFDDRRTVLNFARYGRFADRPGFHVDDPEWQQRFAQECLEVLAQQG